MSNIKYLAYLKTVEFHSLTKAANLLGYTQPGISHMITSLEQELGFPLLIRAKDGVYPTDEGQQLLYYMRQIVNNETMLKDLANQINGIETGSIRIGVFSSTSTQWVPGLLQKFTALHPNIRVQIIEGTTIELQNLFSENYLDLGLMSDPAPEGFEFIPLMQDPILAIIPQDHPLANEEYISPRELVKYPFIIPQEGADEDIFRPVVAQLRYLEEVATVAKYEGYLSKQQSAIERAKKLEDKALPQDADYLSIEGLRLEARQKLDKIRPLNLGQASRISGVSPADITVLMVWLARNK